MRVENTGTRDNSSLYSLTADQASGVIIDGKTGWLEFSVVTEEARGEYRCQAEWCTSVVQMIMEDHGALSYAIQAQLKDGAFLAFRCVFMV